MTEIDDQKFWKKVGDTLNLTLMGFTDRIHAAFVYNSQYSSRKDFPNSIQIDFEIASRLLDKEQLIDELSEKLARERF